MLEVKNVLLNLCIMNSPVVSYFYRKMHISNTIQSFLLVIHFIKTNRMALKAADKTVAEKEGAEYCYLSQGWVLSPLPVVEHFMKSAFAIEVHDLQLISYCFAC